ncbi:nuclear transport factor 2 family protein [Sphingomonas gei]|uniref:Nuclear transport factor 2 family protein n=1 Tax=Sphingomonas gei TaxID=1395960 RepID=A0A4S1X4F5_9SPHN|nr:nuclear transport factor 2 family protein [Sphingomonas gei]TGX49186.1 nuclear transport factor 2 family protein [Sphingomonas gei]
MNDRPAPANRRELIRQFFRYADAGDTRALEFYTEDVDLTYPKFGKAIGKDAVRTFITHMSGVFGRLEHDIDGLSFIEDGDKIVVEGRERGEMADGTPFPDGRISQGLFCNVYEFEGDLFRAVRIYVDPDFTSSDAAMLSTLRPAG